MVYDVCKWNRHRKKQKEEGNRKRIPRFKEKEEIQNALFCKELLIQESNTTGMMTYVGFDAMLESEVINWFQTIEQEEQSLKRIEC